jgi:hypothetical protein
MNAPIEVGLQINLGTPKCLHQTEPDWRLLRVRAQRPGVSSATNKYDEFPSPHGFAPAEDYIGYAKNITFWIGNCVVRYIPGSRPTSALGQKRTSAFL